MPRHDCTECVDCRLSACPCLCHVFNRFYDRGAADVEARIDAAIAKRGLVYVTDRASLRGWILSTSQGRSLTTAERVLLDILDPETKP